MEEVLSRGNSIGMAGVRGCYSGLVYRQLWVRYIRKQMLTLG
jgi:hypothetical protein